MAFLMNCKFPTLFLLITACLILITNSASLVNLYSRYHSISERGDGSSCRTHFDNYNLNKRHDNKFERRYELEERNEIEGDGFPELGERT
ncbi:32102_t:CDS:2 [Racocetra persica]|uniref:32102_t:CDS:1 n=1 Tax=Racocetra persica TaxID=160502 RepID=A0ACA9Q5S0_9GLOM|nr:32102_t:CDS:2 [Racocetra persica]